MEKYKICPSCKTRNEPTLFECVNCEVDLTRVEITDEENEKIVTENAAIQAPTKTNLVRVCECGTINPPNARRCSSCNENISDITPTPEVADKHESTTYVLSSLDGQYVYKMTTNEVIIGRENIMSEYLSSKSYVSRTHIRLVLENNELFVENLSKTNFTYVNNEKITAKVKLEDGNEIGLGGTDINGKCQSEAAYFLVRINRCM